MKAGNLFIMNAICRLSTLPFTRFLVFIVLVISVLHVDQFLSCFFNDISFYKLLKNLIFLFGIMIIVLNE